VSPRAIALAVAVAAGMALAAVLPAMAQAHTITGIVPDVPTGTQIPHIAPLPKAADLPYNGGPVLHSNRTHPIFWEPAGSGLAFDPGYESLIQTFLIDVAADSHKTTNVYSVSGQYTDSSGPAAYDSTFGGAVLDTDPLPPNGCTEPAVTGPGWTVCLTDAQLETEFEHVVATDQLPTTNRDIYFIIMPNGFGSCTDSSSSSCALGGSESGYCGYHSETPSRILYAVIPYNAVPGHCQSNNPRPNSSTADPTISTISHEHNETVTDPEGNAWIDAMGEEEADLCLTTFGPSVAPPGATPWNESIHGGHFFLQEEWSNASGGCEPRAKPDSVSFAMNRLAGRARSVSVTGRGSAPQGRIVSFQWFFGDGRTASGRRASHTFKLPGAYRVMLRATDSWGNWAYAGRTVRVTAIARSSAKPGL
jgi:PKD domain-containing protein